MSYNYQTVPLQDAGPQKTWSNQQIAIASVALAGLVGTVAFGSYELGHSQSLYTARPVTVSGQTTTSVPVAPRFHAASGYAPIVRSEAPQQPTTMYWSANSEDMQYTAQAPQTGIFTFMGIGALVAGAIALVYNKVAQHKIASGDLQAVDMAMATFTGEADDATAEDEDSSYLPGVARRPAGYKHDVTPGYQLEEVSRPRRNRLTPAHRAFMRETHMVPANFVAPLFIHDEDFDQEIPAMPGCSRLCAASVLKEVGECVAEGVNFFILFPKIPDELKTPDGRQCYDETDIVMRTVKAIKAAYPSVVVCTDVALDPYNTDGHDGIVDPKTGYILNDITVEQLCKQAVQQAKAGADIVAPSDMQDGRVGAIRDALDEAGFVNVGIMTYCAKYASAFYGPFRAALDSAPGFGDKSTYQMDPANAREALREIELDEAEGADILMVKPAMPYLDIIKLLNENSSLPIAAYHVSGEYSMIKAAAAAGYIDEEKVALESLLSIRRAGADLILTYYAKQASKWMNEPNGFWQNRLKGHL